MSTEIVRPNSNVHSNWTTFDYSNIQSTTQPTTPSSSPFISASADDDTEVQGYACANPAGSGTISSATLWFYGQCLGASETGFSSRIKLGGSWQSGQTGIATSSEQWNSKTWSGLSISMSGLNPEIEFTAPTTIGKAQFVWIKSAYIELTYSVGDSYYQGGSGKNTARLMSFLELG